MEYYDSLNDENNKGDPLELFITPIIILPICLPGIIGNGIVIWLLGFNIKKNPFTTYIFNLSIADFCLLTVEAIYEICLISDLLYEISFMDYLDLLYESIFLFPFMTRQFLLTIMSIDRCVCLFFPLWHRCHWPTHLSTAVCLIIWLLTFLISAADTILTAILEYDFLGRIHFYLNAVVFMPIMCASMIAMLIKVCIRSQQKKLNKMLRAILLTLVFFFLFDFPINVIYSLELFQKMYNYFYFYAYIAASLNSTINPMIYYLVGRDKTERSSRRINIALEKLFREEEHYREEQETLTETQV